MDSLLITNTDKTLPDCPSDKELCTRFADFFDTKIQKIRTEIDQDPSGDMYTRVATERLVPFPMTELAATCDSEVSKIIQSTKPKSSQLDIMPTWLLKETLPAHVPVLTALANQSFQTGIFPENLKRAIVTPLLKKPSLDKNCLQNHRPVSSLPLVAKVIEKVAAKRLTKHLSDNNLHEELQSAYKAQHSTETALLRVQHDIAGSMGESKAVVLVLLDLSSAFDTIDCAMLLETMNKRLGISGTALKWFESYMSNRTQRVVIGSETSADHPLRYGVPQGSVLGPLLFSVYTSPLQDIMQDHSVDHHKFADDLQLYTMYFPNVTGDLELATNRLTNCTRDIRCWLTYHKLKLNSGKTELLVCLSPHQLKRFGRPEQLIVGDAVIKPVTSVRNLGSHFDMHLTMSDHVKETCRKCNFHLRRIATIRAYITKSVCHKLVIALVVSNLDYCNALLCDIPSYLVRKLQVVHNRAARLVTLTRPRAHITPVLEALHWLPITHRITFKLCVYVYKCLNGLAPSYLADLLTPKTRNPRLRQLHDHLELSVPRVGKDVGRRAFGTSAPAYWNALPLSLREAPSLMSFKKQLKTHFFRVAFEL